jgi:hypothetical protein
MFEDKLQASENNIGITNSSKKLVEDEESKAIGKSSMPNL